jgi:hypothetical protein
VHAEALHVLDKHLRGNRRQRVRLCARVRERVGGGLDAHAETLGRLREQALAVARVHRAQPPDLLALDKVADGNVRADVALPRRDELRRKRRQRGAAREVEAAVAAADLFEQHNVPGETRVPDRAVAQVDVRAAGVGALGAAVHHVVVVQRAVLRAPGGVQVGVLGRLEVRTLSMPPKVRVCTRLRQHLLEARLLRLGRALCCVEVCEAASQPVGVVLHAPGHGLCVLAPHNAHALEHIVRDVFQVHCR